MVFDDLVLHDAHAGLLARHLRQRDAGLVGRHRCGKKDFVHLLLGIGCKFLLGFAHFLHALLQRLHGIDDRIFSGWRGNV